MPLCQRPHAPGEPVIIGPLCSPVSSGAPHPLFLLPPNSYLYYYIRLFMSLISLFFFALTFGKPLNYFTIEIGKPLNYFTFEKEDF
jgi:hypothetical protein